MYIYIYIYIICIYIYDKANDVLPHTQAKL